MDRFKGKRVFVSWGSGVIGSVLVDKLYRGGAKVLVGDLKPRPKGWPKEIAYWKGDLNDISPKEILDFSPEYYFHLAATFERTEESDEFWKENFHHNICLSHYLLEIVKQCKELQRIVFASSYLVYDPLQYLNKKPVPKSTILSEYSPINPRNLCGSAKLLHEKELEFHHATPSVSARIFRVFGRNSRDVISRWIQSLKNNETITVYGKRGSFDFIFADDVAEGLIRLAQTEFIGHVNLGTGQSRKIEEVVEILREYFPKMKVKHETSAIQYENSEADITLLKRLTEWRPENTLETGIEKII